jgi:hypothetical protein
LDSKNWSNIFSLSHAWNKVDMCDKYVYWEIWFSKSLKCFGSSFYIEQHFFNYFNSTREMIMGIVHAITYIKTF